MAIALLSMLVGCGPSASDGNQNNNNDNNQHSIDCGSAGDADGDGICDDQEGRQEGVDTDRDGIPDYLDLDSDDDGIPDAIERGDGESPRDSDADGVADFRDRDSDGNGIEDDVDGTGDWDGDGLADYADLDDDGDTIPDAVEIGPDPDRPRDTDQDQHPDHQDLDADGDTILDVQEGVNGGLLDTDEDGVPDFQDLDSDGDGIADRLEAGDDDPATPPRDSDGDLVADFRDVDSDNDGLSDANEDRNGNGQVDPGETDPYTADSDGDQASDLVEVAAGTDPQDPADNPRARGDFVFVVPYQASPVPVEDRLGFVSTFQSVDLYLLEDVSYSMVTEIGSIKAQLVNMMGIIGCQPGEDPTLDQCIPDVQTGAGRFGANAEVWAHLKDIDADHAGTQNALPDQGAGGLEQHIRALDGLLSGSCASDAARMGQACFRPDALRLILLITDEDFHEDAWYGGDLMQFTYDDLADAGVRVVGVTGNDSEGELAQLRLDLLQMQGGSPAVTLVPPVPAIPNTPECLALGASPFHDARAIVSGPETDAATAITCAVQALITSLPQDVGAVMANDPNNHDDHGDPVDAVSAFVHAVEVHQAGTAACPDGFTTSDPDQDGFHDRYQAVLPGTPLCWKLYAGANTTVEHSASGPQLFRARMEVRGVADALLDHRDVYFLVPPRIEGPGAPD